MEYLFKRYFSLIIVLGMIIDNFIKYINLVVGVPVFLAKNSLTPLKSTY